MDISSDFLSCPICYTSFNHTDRQPMVIPGCGHTICSHCLSAILTDPRSTKCPLDNKRFSINQVGIESFPVNFIVKQLFDRTQSGSESICPHHKEKIRLICLTDKCKVCEVCAFHGEHQGHNFESLKKFEEAVNKKRKELSDLVNKFDAYQEELKGILEEKRESILQNLREKFAALKWVLIRKEVEISHEVNSLFDYEKVKIEENTGFESDYYGIITERISHIREILNSEDVFKIIEQDLSKIPAKIIPPFLHEQAQYLHQKFDRQSAYFESLLKGHVESLELLCFPMKGVPKHKSLNPYYSQNSQNDSTSGLPFNILNKNHFMVDAQVDSLGISLGKSSSPGHLNCLMDEWPEYGKIVLKIENTDNMHKNLEVLSYIWKNLGEITSLKIEFVAKGVNDNHLLGLFSILFSTILDLTEFSLDLSDCKVSDQSIQPLFVNILPHFTSLKRLYLNLSSSYVTDHSLEGFGKNLHVVLGDLDTFDVRLWGSMVTDTGISHLFTNMERLKTLVLDFGATRITDKGLKDISFITLSSINKLETFKIGLSATNVTDEGVSHLLMNIRNAEILSLNLNQTQITGKTLQLLTKTNLPLLHNFKHFDLRLNSTKINDEDIIPIIGQPALKSVEHLTLKLRDTNITDKTIDIFLKKIFPYMKFLQDFEINVTGAKVNKKNLDQLLTLRESFRQANGRQD